ncbi:MAG: GGDEF domain-containing protein [Pseudidiomarina maritima]|nr:GGDEF domain-containing protein [Pseudidiomarina maritima]
MHRVINQQVIQEWHEQIEHAPSSLLQTTLELVETHRQALADAFYSGLLTDTEAAVFLSHQQVKNKLHSSLQSWLHNLFGSQTTSTLQASIAHQLQIGDVHARLKIPMHLVLRGARLLKRSFSELALQNTNTLVSSKTLTHFFDARLDMAMEVMSQAYALATEKKTRSDEAYRLFSMTQNLATERERQKAAVLDWENRLMFEFALGAGGQPLSTLAGSDFGLWFRHKGTHAFHDYAEVRDIADSMTTIDEVLLPVFGLSNLSAEQRLDQLKLLREEVQKIRFWLEDIFSRSSELESGRDVLTRLLNRKFLPTVLTREIEHARSQQSSFALVLVDVDHFKQVNDNYGHEVGDMVLQQVSTLLMNNSRSGDFVFRMGGEEFLLVIVDTDVNSAQNVAEKVRKVIEKEVFLLPNEQQLKVTVSMGLAAFAGHPDYQLLLKAADQALYRAKQQGRNRLELAQ